MAESKLENLVSRLEKVVLQLEGSAPSASLQKPAGPTSLLPSLDEFNAQLKGFEELGKQLDLQELQELTTLCLTAFSSMRKIMEFSTVGKLTPEQKKEVQTILVGQLKKIGNLASNQKISIHVKAVSEAMNSVFWVLVETPELTIKGYIESSEFHGLKLKALKVQPYTKWYDALISSLKSLAKYTLANFATGLSWNFKGTAEFKSLVDDLNGLKPVAAAPLPVKTEEAPSKANLLSALNQGENITKGLKPVTADMKGKPVGEADLVKKTAAPAVQEKKEEPAVKPPKKYQKENWFVENFVGEKMIEFPENECSIKESIFVENCKNSTLMIKGKVKSVFLSKCVKVNLIFKAVVSTVECVNSKSIELICLDSAPTINIDKSESVHVCLPANLNSDIISSKATALNITYQLADGDYEKDTPIPEQLVTKWDPEKKKFVSKPLDLFM